jgi:hypothetical protein
MGRPGDAKRRPRGWKPVVTAVPQVVPVLCPRSDRRAFPLVRALDGLRRCSTSRTNHGTAPSCQNSAERPRGLRSRLTSVAVVSYCFLGWIGPSLGRMISGLKSRQRVAYGRSMSDAALSPPEGDAGALLAKSLTWSNSVRLVCRAGGSARIRHATRMAEDVGGQASDLYRGADRGFPARGRSPIGPGCQRQARSTACRRRPGLIASGA